jgi:uncharacterized damage-inducible protein DinB
MTQPPLAPDERVSAGTEREVLAAFLDLHRAVLCRKVGGLSDADTRRGVVPTGTTLAGLVKHLAAVEREWFQRVLGRRSPEEIGADSDAGDASFRVDPDETVDELIADYDEACAQSRRIAAGLPLDHAVPHARLGRVSLRWIYAHMIEETARHVGHADILRELTDGATGVDG